MKAFSFIGNKINISVMYNTITLYKKAAPYELPSELFWTLGYKDLEEQGKLRNVKYNDKLH